MNVGVRAGAIQMPMTESVWTNREYNPLDLLEEIIGANDWHHDRTSDEELAVEVQGRWCDYRLFFLWDEQQGALHLSCIFETRVCEARREEIFHLLALVNERLWIGHFDLCSSDGTLMFRHTLLFGGSCMVTAGQFEEFMNTLVGEPDRYYPAFQYVIWGGKSAPDAIAAALVDVVGEA